MRKLSLFLPVIFFWLAMFASEEEYLQPGEVKLSYRHQALKKPLQFEIVAKDWTLTKLVMIYGDDVFIIPATIRDRMKPINPDRIRVSCEQGYPEVGGFTIYFNIEQQSTASSEQESYYVLAFNSNGFYLFRKLRTGPASPWKTEHFVPPEKTMKINPISREKYQQSSENRS